MDIKITVPYDVRKLTGKDLAVYSALYQMGYGVILSANLYVSVWDVVELVKCKPQDVKDSLEKLTAMPEITICHLGRDKYAVDLGTMFTRMKSFIQLPALDVAKILNGKLRCRFDLLHLFALVIARVSHDIEFKGNKYFVTDLSAGYFAKVIGVEVHTIFRNIKYLEDMGVLYVFRVGNMRHSNLMGLVRNRELIDEYAEMCGFSKKERYT